MKSISENLQKFVKNNFYDEKYGGFYAVLNKDKNDIVTEDKLLLDIALGLIVFTELKDTSTVKKLLEDIKLFKDNQNIGYYEILDTVSRPYPAGKVKTIFTQLLTMYGIYKAANLVGETNISINAIVEIGFIVDKYDASNNSTRFSMDWQSTISEEKRLKDISLITIILNELSDIQTSFDVFDLLDRFIDPNKGAYSYLNVDNSPKNLGGKHLLDMAIFMMALTSLNNPSSKYNHTFEKTVHFISANFRHPLTKGFWDKSDVNGKVSFDPTPNYYNHNESPFPIKSMMSHAVFLLALKKYKVKYKNLTFEKFENEIIEQLNEYYDTKNGGISLGQGYWFSTPTNPTVPLARHAMVPPFTIGAFAVGNTNYLPLHEKTISLQLISILALE
ncbi:hypothetical protein [Enterococcus plantarum]|uniref:hypothetical protein n=1 Tax=Enterococcus plantarum TaxID=1077675 RepID=UPI001A8FAF99|nr:hypothetical protein [Enterococcus plantarum]MBO0422307.1 hypothetical protein [Enterococcus plantarum]